MTYYRLVNLNDEGDTDEVVAYVGTHPITWHRHPDEPQVGFTPAKEVDELVEAVREMVRLDKELQTKGDDGQSVLDWEKAFDRLEKATKGLG